MANVSYKNVSKKLVRAIYKLIRYQAKGITRLLCNWFDNDKYSKHAL